MTSRRHARQPSISAQDLVRMAQRFVELHGMPRICGNHHIDNARPLCARIGASEIHYLQKAGRLPGAPLPWLIEIYVDGLGKVFSAWFDPIDVVTIRKRAAWLPAFMDALAAETAPS